MSKKLYEGRRKGCMKKFIHVIDESLEEILMVLMLAAMTLIMGCQVFSRYILGVSLSWSEEITRYLFIWSAFLSVSLCTRKCISIKVDQFICIFCLSDPFLLSIFKSNDRERTGQPGVWSANVLCAVSPVFLFYFNSVPHRTALVW